MYPNKGASEPLWAICYRKQQQEWYTVWENIKKMRFDRSPAIPTTFDEFMEHKADIKAMQDSLRERKEAAEKPLGFDLQAIESIGLGEIIDEQTILNRTYGLGDVTVWAPFWMPSEEHEEALWPEAQELREEGDERHTSGFGRFLPIPRVPGNATVAWKQRPFLRQYEMDRVRPVAKKYDHVMLPRDIEVPEPTVDDYGVYIDDMMESGRVSHPFERASGSAGFRKIGNAFRADFDSDIPTFPYSSKLGFFKPRDSLNHSYGSPAMSKNERAVTNRMHEACRGISNERPGVARGSHISNAVSTAQKHQTMHGQSFLERKTDHSFNQQAQKARRGLGFGPTLSTGPTSTPRGLAMEASQVVERGAEVKDAPASLLDWYYKKPIWNVPDMRVNATLSRHPNFRSRESSGIDKSVRFKTIPEEPVAETNIPVSNSMASAYRATHGYQHNRKSSIASIWDPISRVERKNSQHSSIGSISPKASGGSKTSQQEQQQQSHIASTAGTGPKPMISTLKGLKLCEG